MRVSRKNNSLCHKNVLKGMRNFSRIPQKAVYWVRFNIQNWFRLGGKLGIPT